MRCYEVLFRQCNLVLKSVAQCYKVLQCFVVLHEVTKSYTLSCSVTQCYTVFHTVTLDKTVFHYYVTQVHCCTRAVLRSVIQCYAVVWSVTQSIMKCYKVLQIVTKCFALLHLKVGKTSVVFSYCLQPTCTLKVPKDEALDLLFLASHSAFLYLVHMQRPFSCPAIVVAKLSFVPVNTTNTK